MGVLGVLKRGFDHIGDCFRREGFKASENYKLITMFSYDCFCQVYCLFFGLTANKYVLLYLNLIKSVYGDSRCHVNKKISSKIERFESMKSLKE